MTIGADHAMRVLLDRLNWPVRFVRWQAARGFAELFESHQASLALDVYLDWMASRRFEMEAVSGLSILLCTKSQVLPPAKDVRSSIRKPSILAEFLFQQVYGEVLGGWRDGHSAAAPPEFEAPRYFYEHIGQVIPQILESKLADLEEASGFPFRQQWAFEWQALVDETNSSYSGYPHYFINDGTARSGVSGSFSLLQCTVYRSAFLRTLAFAVQHWGMPPDSAALASGHCLPLNKHLERLEPARRPRWLRDMPEQSGRPGAPMETLIRQIVKPRIAVARMRPVSLHIPLSAEVGEFGELSVEGCFITDDYVPSDDDSADKSIMLWHLDGMISFAGSLSEVEPDRYRVQGANGFQIPVCLSAWPIHLGFWQAEYAHVGIRVPAPFHFASPPSARVRRGRLELSAQNSLLAQTSVWHDNWSSVHPIEGHTRIGTVTEMRSDALNAALAKYRMKLGWNVQLKVWQRPTSYGDLSLRKQSLFLRDSN